MGSVPVHSQSSSLREQNTFQVLKPTDSNDIVNFHQKIQKEGQGINIKVATFNYGYCDSPFQYYGQNDIENYQEHLFQKLSSLFSQILEKQIYHSDYFCFKEIKSLKYLNQLEKDKINTLIKMYDRRYRINRYSPLYYRTVGVQKTFYFTTKQRFCYMWKKCLKESLKNQNFYLKNNRSWQLTENDRQAFQYLCIFDWVCFIIILLYSCKSREVINSLNADEAEKQFYKMVEKDNNHQYQMVMMEEFSKKVIDEQHKIKKLLDFLDGQKLDILFVQNASKFLIEQIEKKTNHYRVAFSERIKAIILISWDCMAKLQPSGEIKPLEFYNRIHIPHTRLIPKQKRKASSIGKNTRYGQFVQQGRDLKEPEEIDDNFFSVMKQTISVTQGQLTQRQNPQSKQMLIPKIQSSSSSSSSSQDSQFQSSSSSSSSSSSQSSSDEENGKIRLAHDLKSVLKQIMKNKMSSDLYKALLQFQGAFIQFFDRLILISWECESKEKLLKAKEALRILQNQFQQYHIIMGCQVRDQVNELSDLHFHVYPGESNKMDKQYRKQTFLKVDNFLFGSPRQIGSVNRKINTHVFSTIEFEEKGILNIEGRQIDFDDDVLIPSQTHPYEEFLVFAEFQYYRFQNMNSRKKAYHLTYASLQKTI